ncbi:Cof-type HAD-IIB family hydrolase [Allofournierella sp. CML151]|uniref:Cof-type HAD-IIB family hydrolase n=1 Tax=Allofournierella sp. CML151 TaxID=2998082 RepID=UPI0022EB2B2A|nr:HAD family hydrolase [Fournierella sp. CML151]
MQYKAIVLDVDGTLVAHGEPSARPAVAAAVKAVQKQGVKVVIASGRTSFAVEPAILGGIRPDYLICANGAQLLDGQGRLLSSQDMTAEEMYALVDFFEDFDYPLAFCFGDKYYVYVEYKAMKDFYQSATGHGEYVADGEDQDRHLESMPCGAFAILPPEKVDAFQERYGYLGLKFVPYRPGYYDVMQADVDKTKGMERLMKLTGWKPEELVFVGDNDNDVAMMGLAGCSYCMGSGSEKAKAAAKHIAPGVQEEGVRQVLEELFLK